MANVVKSRMNRCLAAGSVLALAVSAMPLQAEELPFYKAGTSAPAARTAASTATSTTAAPIDSRTVQSADSAEVKFDSSGAPGVLLIVR